MLESSFLIVHIGAGNHQKTLDEVLKRVLHRALRCKDNNGIKTLIRASKILDECPLINSGFGSSLNIEGKVSNDSSVLQYDGSKLLRYNCLHNMNHKYPIQETINLYDHLDRLFSLKRYNEIGMTKPRILDYSASLYIYQSLDISPESQETVLKKQQKLFDVYDLGLSNYGTEIQDTIGIIHIAGNTTSLAASSGGNFLKMPGRVGCAGVVGAGIVYKKTEDLEISCMCSGNGEDIILLNLADLVSKLELDPTTIDEYIRSAWNNISGVSTKLYVGVIIVINDISSGCKRIMFYHTTETFYFAFTDNKQTKVVLSKLKGNYIVGEYLSK